MKKNINVLTRYKSNNKIHTFIESKDKKIALLNFNEIPTEIRINKYLETSNLW